MSAIRQISQHFEIPSPAAAPPLANPWTQDRSATTSRDPEQVDRAAVAAGFRRLLPLDGSLEPHLRGVLHDTLEHPGSLVRAHLAYGILRGAEVVKERALPLAIAIEYFHTASLLFDDLPSMNNAQERRGQPCPHCVHGEAATILGALALVNQGYALLWQVLGELPPQQRRQAGDLVARCLGERGILDGQARDLHFHEGPQDAEEVLRVAEGKTVTLVRLTLLLPALVAGLDGTTCERLDHLATVWGLSYQILDDYKDGLMGQGETGKTSHRDQALGRPNFPALFGQFRAARRLAELLAEGRELVANLAAEQGEQWRTVVALQTRLEAEAKTIQDKLRHSSKPTPAPHILRRGSA